MSWQALAVGAAGQVRSFPIDTLAHGYRGFEFVMRRFATEPARDRNAICAAWVNGAERRFGPGTHVVRIYRVEWRLSRRRVPPRSTLVWKRGAPSRRKPELPFGVLLDRTGLASLVLEARQLLHGALGGRNRFESLIGNRLTALELVEGDDAEAPAERGQDEAPRVERVKRSEVAEANAAPVEPVEHGDHPMAIALRSSQCENARGVR
jgi:hypothetical protein